MAVYVVDASVVIQYAIEQSYTAAARTLIGRMYEGEVRLLLPEFCLLECTNVLWKEVRFQGMPPSQARATIAELLALNFQILPTKHLLPQALQIGLSCQLAIYDSLYIALALEQNSQLITVDRRQKAAAVSNGVSLKPITDLMPEARS